MGRPEEDVMAKQILLAGILGGIALFVWGGLAHQVLGLGSVGVQTLPQQQPVMDALKAASPASGFYYFPQADASGRVAPEKAGGPAGILIYQSTGAGKPLGGQLINEGILNIVLALFAAWLVSLASGLTSYVARVGFVTLLGVPVALMSNVESWNWYGYPLNYTAATILENLIGFLVVGLVAAAFVKPAGQRMTAVPARAA
jgi:hypothetical protein